MKKRALAFVIWAAGIAACSVINSPDVLQPQPDDTTGGTDGTAGSSSKAGKPSTAGSTTNGGADVGSGGCGPDCEGGAPPIGRVCDSSLGDCGSSAPICEPATGCRACTDDRECQTAVGQNFCLTEGYCGECRSDEDCAGDTPICSKQGQCRGCASHDQCESKVCDSTGACGAIEDSVYALAETGETGANCGTIEAPCWDLGKAAAKLSAQRHNLVLIKTTSAFTSINVTLPAVKGLKIIGNGVAIKSYGPSAFIVPANTEVTFDGVAIEGSIDKDEAGIECTGADITVVGSNLHDNGTAVSGTDCDVTVTQSVLSHNANPLEYGSAGIKTTCTAAMGCAKRFLVTRNRFLDNGVALQNWGYMQATIENNLFLRNGFDGYTRVIELRAAQTRFAYNTLVENFNGCTYVGVVACDEGVCSNIGNISYKSFPAEMSPCYDQVWYNGTLSYSLTEATYPGTTNEAGDPLFVDAAGGDFTPGEGSPAIDGGNPNDAPDVDIDGRPRGDAPDMGAFEAQ